MKLLKDGTWVDFDTKIGTVKFRDPNGAYEISVYTSGEFWRVVCFDWSPHESDLTPTAARKLAALLIKAADKADKETEYVDKIGSQD